MKTIINTEALSSLFEGFEFVDARQEIKVTEYQLRYFFAGWHNCEKIYAESIDEAIYFAEKSIKTDKIWYALFDGNKIVKEFGKNPVIAEYHID